MSHPNIQPSKHPTTIDILLRVIDNYGDIGFCLELIMAWRRIYGNDVEFVIWTDAVEFVNDFITRSAPHISHTRVDILDHFGRYKRSRIAFALFHAPIPDNRFFEENSLVLRIDYLSFDPEWNTHHGDEHILSTPTHRIIEIIPSPIGAGGQILPYRNTLSRIELTQRYGLNPSREWISIFAYKNTIESILDFDNFDNDGQVIVFGYSGEKVLKNTIVIPWVAIDTWHAFIDESVWVLARGEVSAMATLCRGKLGFWDMYKELGGWHAEQSESFLTYMEVDTRYRDLHLRLNGQIIGGVSLSELDAYTKMHQVSESKKHTRTKNLIEEIKKYIDSHQFSI